MDAQTIARSLGNATRSGQGWTACCPVHEDKSPSLSLRHGDDGRLLAYCFAGCRFIDIMGALEQRGLLEGKVSHFVMARDSEKQAENQRKRIEWAKRIWRESVPAGGTLVETYLQARGYTGDIPVTIRFHQNLKHKESGLSLPAMVVAVALAPGQEIVAVHRTYLRADGKAKAGVANAKLTLGTCRGGAVRLTNVESKLAITEGIETGLSVMQATGIPTWAALSAGGIERLILPPLPLAAEVIICADNDASGTGERVANKAAQRFLNEGRRVRLAMPPTAGQDFNDILREAV